MALARDFLPRPSSNKRRMIKPFSIVVLLLQFLSFIHGEEIKREMKVEIQEGEAGMGAFTSVKLVYPAPKEGKWKVSSEKDKTFIYIRKKGKIGKLFTGNGFIMSQAVKNEEWELSNTKTTIKGEEVIDEEIVKGEIINEPVKEIVLKRRMSTVRKYLEKRLKDSRLTLNQRLGGVRGKTEIPIIFASITTEGKLLCINKLNAFYTIYHVCKNRYKEIGISPAKTDVYETERISMEVDDNIVIISKRLEKTLEDFLDKDPNNNLDNFTVDDNGLFYLLKYSEIGIVDDRLNNNNKIVKGSDSKRKAKGSNLKKKEKIVKNSNSKKEIAKSSDSKKKREAATCLIKEKMQPSPLSISIDNNSIFEKNNNDFNLPIRKRRFIEIVKVIEPVERNVVVPLDLAPVLDNDHPPINMQRITRSKKLLINSANKSEPLKVNAKSSLTNEKGQILSLKTSTSSKQVPKKGSTKKLPIPRQADRNLAQELESTHSNGSSKAQLQKSSVTDKDKMRLAKHTVDYPSSNTFIDLSETISAPTNGHLSKDSQSTILTDLVGKLSDEIQDSNKISNGKQTAKSSKSSINSIHKIAVTNQRQNTFIVKNKAIESTENRLKYPSTKIADTEMQKTSIIYSCSTSTSYQNLPALNNNNTDSSNKSKKSELKVKERHHEKRENSETILDLDTRTLDTFKIGYPSIGAFQDIIVFGSVSSSVIYNVMNSYYFEIGDLDGVLGLNLLEIHNSTLQVTEYLLKVGLTGCLAITRAIDEEFATLVLHEDGVRVLIQEQESYQLEKGNIIALVKRENADRVRTELLKFKQNIPEELVDIEMQWGSSEADSQPLAIILFK